MSLTNAKFSLNSKLAIATNSLHYAPNGMYFL